LLQSPAFWNQLGLQFRSKGEPDKALAGIHLVMMYLHNCPGMVVLFVIIDFSGGVA
jgi:hypothetical protein